MQKSTRENSRKKQYRRSKIKKTKQEFGFAVNVIEGREVSDANFVDRKLRMFRHLGWLVGLNYKSSSKRLPDAPAQLKPVAMLDAVQEIAIYIHRFHNLDLFQQGSVPTSQINPIQSISISISFSFPNYDSFMGFSRWYQIKITMRWEHTEYTSVGTPARVVQYEGAFFHFHFHLWSKVVKYPSCFLVAISVKNGIIKYPSCF